MHNKKRLYHKRLIFPALLFFMVFFSHKGIGQDLHFSQFFHNPLLTSPANTGFNPDYDYRVGASYRGQWNNLPVPYRTFSVWGDAQLFRNRFETGWLGLGGVLLRDQAGPAGNLNSTKGYASIAWHQELGYTSLISGGFNVGYASKSLNPYNFRWENQWMGKFFDANAPIGENFARTNIGYFDLQAGLNYAWFPNDNTYIHGGVSVMHVNTPRESFFDANVSDNRIPVRYNAFANASLKVDERWIVNPNLYYSQQAGSREIVGGVLAQYYLGGYVPKQVLGGLYYRWNDAAIAMVGLQWGDTRLTFSYDATVSTMRQFNNGYGALEFSLIHSGIFPGSSPRNTRCPVF